MMGGGLDRSSIPIRAGDISLISPVIMPPDTRNFLHRVEKTVKQLGGVVLELNEQDHDYEIAFVAKGQRFHLRHQGGRGADGSGLFHIANGEEIDVYQNLYGFRGDKNDIDAVMEYIGSRPGNGLAEWCRFFPQMLREYLEAL